MKKVESLIDRKMKDLKYRKRFEAGKIPFLNEIIKDHCEKILMLQGVIERMRGTLESFADKENWGKSCLEGNFPWAFVDPPWKMAKKALKAADMGREDKHG